MCPHSPTCPSAEQPDREAARVVSCHPEQGWSLLCNGLIIFEDTGGLLPDCSVVAPHRTKIDYKDAYQHRASADGAPLPAQRNRRRIPA